MRDESRGQREVESSKTSSIGNEIEMSLDGAGDKYEMKEDKSGFKVLTCC